MSVRVGEALTVPYNAAKVIAPATANTTMMILMMELRNSEGRSGCTLCKDHYRKLIVGSTLTSWPLWKTAEKATPTTNRHVMDQ